MDGEPSTLLVVDSDEAQVARLRPALAPHLVLTAATGEEARQTLANRTDVSGVLARFRLGDESGLKLLEHCQQQRADVVRLLVAEHSDLPEIVQARASGLVRRVISIDAPARRVQQVIADELGEAFEATATRKPPSAGADPRKLRDLLRWTVERVTRVRGLVLRELPKEREAQQVQLVVPVGPALEKLRGELAAGWPLCLQQPGAVPRRDHPVLQHLPDLGLGCEVRALELNRDVFAWLTVLPWRDRSRATVALGLAGDSVRLEDLHLLAFAHRVAREEIAELPLPELPSDDESTGAGQPIFEYDWISAPGYVGPDRRRQPTSLLNRFVLIGRRRRVSSKIRRLRDVFVDRAAPGVWPYLAVIAALLTADTWLTFRFAFAGGMSELNPLLRPLGAGLAFFAVKNALSLAALLVVIRFQLFRAGIWLLRGMLAACVALDLYWLVLVR